MLGAIDKKGLAFGVLTYSIWGFFPLYFKSFSHLPVDEVLVHRVVWSVAFGLVMVLLFRRMAIVKAVLFDTRTLAKLALSSLLLSLNWLIFIYATVSDNILQMSLGYFINPIFNMVFGLLLFKESLSAIAKIAIVLALVGLSLQFFQVANFPFLAVSVALLFSLYGVVRKGIAIDPISGLLIETLILLLPALGYLVFFTEAKSLSLMAGSWYWLVMLLVIGPVTSIPLITFSAAVRRIPYYLVGFCQYITPTMMFVWAVFLYKEPWDSLDLLTFSFVWAGVICVIVGSLR